MPGWRADWLEAAEERRLRALAPPPPEEPFDAWLRRATAAGRREMAIRGRRNRSQSMRRRAAALRARRLLRQFLSEEQRAEMDAGAHITVVGSAGGVFRVGLGGYSGNIVKVAEDGRRLESWCVHARESLPLHDHVLAQKLMLETGEPELRRLANVSR